MAGNMVVMVTNRQKFDKNRTLFVTFNMKRYFHIQLDDRVERNVEIYGKILVCPSVCPLTLIKRLLCGQEGYIL